MESLSNLELLPEHVLFNIIGNMEHGDVLSLALTSTNLREKIHFYFTQTKQGKRLEMEASLGRDVIGIQKKLEWTTDLPFKLYKELVDAISDRLISSSDMLGWDRASKIVKAPIIVPKLGVDLRPFESCLCNGKQYVYGVAEKWDDKSVHAFCADKDSLKTLWTVRIAGEDQSQFFTLAVRGYFFVAFFGWKDDEEKETMMTVVVARDGRMTHKCTQIKVMPYATITMSISKGNLEILEHTYQNVYVSKISLANFNTVVMNRRDIIPEGKKPHKMVYWMGQYIIIVHEMYAFHRIKEKRRGRVIIKDRQTFETKGMIQINKEHDYEGVTRDGIVVLSQRVPMPYGLYHSKKLHLLAPFDTLLMRRKLDMDG